MKCIDISSNQGSIDFLKVLNDGVESVIIRTILKSGKEDYRAKSYFRNAQKVGLRTDGYKYSYALSVEEKKNEFELVIAFLRSLDIPREGITIWDDEEWITQRQKLSRQQITDMVKYAQELVLKAGFKFGVYCNLDWYKNVLYPKQLDVPWWIARYPSADDGTIHESLRPKIGEQIWQYSSKGKVNGISGYVDMNDRKAEVSYYSIPKIQQLFQISGLPYTYADRKLIAMLNGIADYEGTADQNMELFKLWADGKLQKI